MKKFLSMVLVFVLLISTLSISAFAAEIPAEKLNGNGSVARATREEYDLGTDGSIRLVSTECKPYAVLYTYYQYTTNSTEINVKVKSDISVSMRITLYDAETGVRVQQKTVTLYTWNRTVTFSGLTSVDSYYLTFENVGQQTVHIEGTISA